jgi:fibronectin-binding autotransporter adhesin
MQNIRQTTKVWFSQRMTVLWFAVVTVLVGSGIPCLISTAKADVTAGWNQDADDNWSTGTNWQGGSAPTGTTGVAYFTNAITASRMVTVNSSPWTIGGLTFGNTGAYGFTITNGTLNALASIVVNPNSVATVFSSISGTANLTKTGSGTLVLRGINNYSGRTFLNAGTTVIDGATISNSGAFDIGAVGSPAEFVFCSGSITAGTQFVIGAHGTSSGVQSNGTLQVNGTFFVGGYGEGPGTGTYTQVGGTVTATSGINFNGGGPNAGIYNLAGGSLSVSSLSKNPGTGTGTFNFNGGVLKPRASSGTFMQGLTTANVQLGGAVLDTAGFNITIAQPLLHDATLGATPDGGLTKLGTGILTLTAANTYTGPTAVSNGVLVVPTTSALPGYATAGKVTVASGAGLSVGVGSWSSTDITALINTGAYSSGSIFGFDTTAGNYTYSGQFALPAVAGLVKTGPNVLTITEGNTCAGNITVLGGILQAAFGTGIPTTASVLLNNASLSSMSATITASLGAGPEQISLTPGTAAGFSAVNTPLTVNLGGAGAPLSWGSSLFNPSVFVLNDTGANAALTFENAIALNATRTINVNASVAEISGVISNGSVTAGLVKGGASTLKLSASNTYSGGTTISAGTLALTGGNNRLNTAGAIALNAGTLDLGGNTQAMTSGNFTMANGTTLQNGTINYKNENWGPNGSASVTFGAGGGFNCPSRLLLWAGQTLTLASGAGASSFGGNGDTSGNFIGVDNANINTVTVNGGSLNFTNMASGAGYLRLGCNGNATTKPVGVLNVNNGVVNVGHTMGLGTRYENAQLENYGDGTLNLSGGEVNVGTGTDTATTRGYRGWLYLGNNHASTVSKATVNLNGGTLSLVQLEAGSKGVNKLNLNGGTLKARADNTSFLNGANLACTLFTGGATIDTAGFNVGIAAKLIGSGALTKKGAGTLVLSATNTYNGTTVIEGGTLKLAATAQISGSAVQLTSETQANLKLRLDASVSSSLFTNATGVGEVTAAGQPVGYWGDLSGNGKPATNATNAARPTYVTGVAAFNNLPVLQFDGSDDELTSALDINPGNLPNLTVMMVFRQVTYKVWGALWGHDDGGFDRFQLLNYGSVGANNISTSGNMTSANGMNTNAVLLYTAVLRNGALNSSYVYINGQSDTTNGLPAFTSTDSGGQPSFTLANIAQGGGLRGNIQIGEVLVFNAALSDEARMNAEAYLKDKWVGMPGSGRVNIANSAVLDLAGASQTLTSVTGAGTLSNGTLTVSEPLSPAGDSIGTLKVSDIAFNATLLATVLLDGTCDQLLGTGNLNLSGLTLQIADTGLLNREKRYTLVTCSGTLTGDFTASLPKNWKIKYDRTAGAATATLVYIPPGTMIRFM